MRSWRRGRSAYDRLRKLQSVMESALAHLTLDELLDELLGRVRTALDADTAAILLLDEETDELVARAAKGIEEEVERGVRIPVGQGFAGRVAATRQSASSRASSIPSPAQRNRAARPARASAWLSRSRTRGAWVES
jgi:signal transduction protein with GAF and PtsI domain